MQDPNTPEAPPAAAPGVGSLRGKALFWVPILPLVLLDLWTKSAVFGFLHAQHAPVPDVPVLSEAWQAWEVGCRHRVIGGNRGFIFDLVCWRNTGTIWGLAQDFTAALVGFRLVAIGVIGYLAWRTPRAARSQLLVLGVILAGAIGNLYDNLFEPQGGVRDFLAFRYVNAEGGHPLDWMRVNPFPAFNVADACISVGAITLAVLWMTAGRGGSKGA